MWATGKESDSILKGEYSLTNLIRTKFKKDDKQPNPGDKGPKKKNKKPSVDEQGDKNPEKKINENENEKSPRNQILEKFKKAWNNDNTWGDLKEKWSKIMDYVCNNEDVFTNYKLSKQVMSFFISFCKNKITEFNVEKVKGNALVDFKIDGNNDGSSFNISLVKVDNNTRDCAWKVFDGSKARIFPVKFSDI